MAIVDNGKILLEAQPLQAVATLKGRRWHKLIAKNAINQLEQKHKIISARLLSGRSKVQVYGPENPGDGFEPIEPALKEVYFSTMRVYYTPTH